MAALTKPLGDFGENLPVNDEFTGIVNLNTLHHNFPLFDHLAYREDVLYLFTVKARHRYGKGGKENTQYNLLPDHATRKFRLACTLLKGHGYDPSTARYGFIVSRVEPENEATYYWGELSEIKPECCYDTLWNGEVVRVPLPAKDTNFAKYKVWGTRIYEEGAKTDL